MPLINQIQGVSGCILLGMFYAMVYHFISSFIDKKNGLIMIPFNILICLLFTYILFIFLTNFVYGEFNLFYLLSLITGIFLYITIYSNKFSKVYGFLHNKLVAQLDLTLYNLIRKKGGQTKNDKSKK